MKNNERFPYIAVNLVVNMFQIKRIVKDTYLIHMYVISFALCV